MPLLTVQGLEVGLIERGGVVPVIDGVWFELDRGETLAIVGESGCGKTVTALAIGRLLPRSKFCIKSGRIIFDGEDLLTITEKRMRSIRGRRISYVFQHAGAVLNPVLTVQSQIMEMLELHRPEAASREEVLRLLELVGFSDPDRVARAYPFMLSGGMQQRVAIAIAIAGEPDLVIADEPTSALDVTIQIRVLDLLKSLQERLGISIIFITHNLRIVPRVGHKLAIFYAGEVVEYGPALAVLTAPMHPYTLSLVRCIPDLGSRYKQLQSIPGTVPTPGFWPEGCRFAPRCVRAAAECREKHPMLAEVSPGRFCRCFRPVVG